MKQYECMGWRKYRLCEKFLEDLMLIGECEADEIYYSIKSSHCFLNVLNVATNQKQFYSDSSLYQSLMQVIFENSSPICQPLVYQRFYTSIFNFSVDNLM